MSSNKKSEQSATKKSDTKDNKESKLIIDSSGKQGKQTKTADKALVKTEAPIQPVVKKDSNSEKNSKPVEKNSKKTAAAKKIIIEEVIEDNEEEDEDEDFDEDEDDDEDGDEEQSENEVGSEEEDEKQESKEKKAKKSYLELSTEFGNCNAKIKLVDSEISEIEKQLKTLEKNKHELERTRNKVHVLMDKAHDDEVKKATKEKPKRKGNKEGGFNKPKLVPPVLCKFLKLEADTLLPRPAIMKMMNNAFKEKGIKEGQDTTLDAATAKALGKESGRVIGFKEFQSFLKEFYNEAFPEEAKKNMVNLN